MYYFKDGYTEEVKSKSVKSELVPTYSGDLKAGEIFREKVLPDDLPSKINKVGYIDPNVRLKQMQEAGIRMDAWNQAVYDFNNAEDEDDGVRMATERNDWDALDLLTEGARERALYEREMYMMYLKGLNEKKRAQDDYEAYLKAKQDDSQTPKEPVKDGVSDSQKPGGEDF